MNMSLFKKKYIFFLLFLSAAFSPGLSSAQSISTFAGLATAGGLGDGGYAIYASFNNIKAIALDPTSGSLYVADFGYNRVRKINAYGIVSTVAGYGASGGKSGDGGPATAAKISGPSGLAVDKSGNLYFSDSRNNCVRKIDSAGIITTFAGNGVAGYAGDDTLAIYAALNNPGSLAFDSTGNLYIADITNGRIRKVDLNGNISTVGGAGTGAGTAVDSVPATDARMAVISGLVVMPNGDIIYSDSYAQRIRKITPDGLIFTIAGSGKLGSTGDDGLAIYSQVSSPAGLSADKDGNIYFADVTSFRVRVIGSDGIIRAVAGSGGVLSGGEGVDPLEAGVPASYVATDVTGNLFVAEVGGRIRFISIHPPESDDKIIVYPNPCFKDANIVLPSKDQEMVTLFVLDQSGRVVSKSMGPTNMAIRVHFESAGTYVLYGVSKNGSWSGKVSAVQ